MTNRSLKKAETYCSTKKIMKKKRRNIFNRK